jgi:hypothetical protein
MPIYPASKTFGYNQLTSISAAVGLANGTSQVSAVAVGNSGGTGYAVGDRVSLNGGTGLSPLIYVTAVSAGVVTAVALAYFANESQPGLYPSGSTPGTSNVATTAVSGSGSGLTLNVTYGVTNTVPASAKQALIQASTLGGQALVWRDDGVAPTSTVGMVINSGDSILYQGTLSQFQVIQQAAGAIANIIFMGF